MVFYCTYEKKEEKTSTVILYSTSTIKGNFNPDFSHQYLVKHDLNENLKENETANFRYL